ncbi:MAG TPA: winged helix-turn-helix domain-containing protein [Terriglobales bacterium]|nr:winged helix-turn-helix domain-containing protein [Terriglobales bacterium]
MYSKSPEIPEFLRFGDDFELDLRAYELRSAGIPLKLKPIPREILFFLVERRGELITRQEIVDRIWGKGVFLDTDNSINGAVSKIRQVLRDDVEQPRFVQTITGKGYRFIAAVQEIKPSHEESNTELTYPAQHSAGNAVSPHASPGGLNQAGESPSAAAAQTLNSRSEIRAIAKPVNRSIVALGLIVLAAAGFGIRWILNQNSPRPFADFTVAQITNNGKVGVAAISPDGKYILHSDNENGLESLRLRNILTGSDAQIVAPSLVRYKGLEFSPDGNYVYFRQLINSIGSEWDAYRLPVLGGSPQLIARDVDSDIVFSPDGKRISYVRANDPENGKYRTLSARLDGGDETVLAVHQIEGFGNEAYPPFNSWSSDGKRIAYSYAKMSDQPGVIRVFDLSSKRLSFLEQLSNSLTFEINWLRNDRWLMLLHAEKGPNFGNPQIGEVSLKSGKLYPITRDTNSYSTMTLSADQKTAATVQVKTTNALNVFPDPPRNIPMIAAPLSEIADVSAFDWTTDGKIVISDGSHIFLAEVNGEKEKTISSDRQAAVLSLASCQNGYILVNWAYRAGTDGETIWRISPDGSSPQRMGTGTHDSSPACSPDSKWAYYIDSLRALMRVPIEGGRPEIVPGSIIPNAYQLLGCVDFSSDGRQLILIADVQGAGAQPSRAKLAIIDSEGRSAPRLLDPDPRIAAGSVYTGGVRFAPDGKSVVYVIREKGTANLWMQPLDGSAGRQITKFTSGLITGFHWSLDRKMLALLHSQTTSDVVVLHESNQ